MKEMVEALTAKIAQLSAQPSSPSNENGPSE